MSKRDTPVPDTSVIEDEPYQGLYRGTPQPAYQADDGHLPDRFDLAEILKNTREAKGLSLEEVADLTRVRRAYLEAFEQAAYDVLPPRAFAIGYVKAYAKALGLDEETLADMFKREVSEVNSRLQSPSGASLEDVKPNYRLYISAAACLVAAVVIWNVVQRQPDLHFGHKDQEAQFGNSSWAGGQPNMLNGAIFVSQPQPAPRDQDVPPAYATPGLEAGFASIEAEKSSTSAMPVTTASLQRKAFNPRGAVYGASPEASSVTLQASKTVNLVIRGSDGTVYFAQSLSAGEAYRVPAADARNLLIDVSDAAAFDIYFNGEFAGGLSALNAPNVRTLVTPVSQLNGKAAQMSATLDQRLSAGGQTAAAPKPAAATGVIAPLTAPKASGPIPYLPSQRPAPPPAAASSVSASVASATKPAGQAASTQPTP